MASGCDENVSLGDHDQVQPGEPRAYLVISELNRSQFILSPVVDVPVTFEQYPFWTLVEDKGKVKSFARLDRIYSMDFKGLKKVNQNYIVLTSTDLGEVAVSNVQEALRAMTIQQGGTSQDAPQQFKMYSTTHGTSWTVLSTDAFHRATGMVLARSWTDHIVVTCIPKGKLLMCLEDGTILGTDPDDVELDGAKQTVWSILMGMPGPEIFLKGPSGTKPPQLVELQLDSVPSDDLNQSDESSESESQLQEAERTEDPPRLVPCYMLEIFQRARDAGFSGREVMGAMEECGVEDPVDLLKKQRKVLQYFCRKAHGQQVEEIPPGLSRGSKDLERQIRRLMVEEELSWEQARAAILLLWTKKWQGYGRRDILSAVRNCGEEPDLRDVMQTILWSINREPNMESPSCL